MYKVFIIGVSKSSPKCLTFLTLTLDSDISIVLAAFRIDHVLCLYSCRVLKSAAISDSAKGQTH